MFGTPILVEVGAATTKKDLYAAVWRQVRRFVVAKERALIDADAMVHPFVLKHTTPNGFTCPICPWTRCHHSHHIASHH